MNRILDGDTSGNLMLINILSLLGYNANRN